MTLKEYQEKYTVRGRLTSPDLWFCRVNQLLVKYNEMDLDVFLPSKGKNLQRGYVWTQEQEVALIESVLIGRTIPPIRYISLISDGCGADKIQLIDGKQRLTALVRFLKDKVPFPIGGKEYYYTEMPSDFRFAIETHVITGQAMYQNYGSNGKPDPITDDEKIKWFMLINHAGTPQELGHINSLL